MSPFGHRAFVSPGDYVVPRHAYGLAMRARRPRPSEKIAFRVIFGVSPLGDRRCGWPPRGGAGSARPWCPHNAHPNVASSRPLAHRKSTGGNAMPYHWSGRTLRTRKAHPSEKTPPRVTSGPSPARPS